MGGYRGDADNDQLSNFIEYMISGLDGFPETDPEKDLNASAMSTFAAAKNQLVPDYFLPVGSLYLGGMFTDPEAAYLQSREYMEEEHEVQEAKQTFVQHIGSQQNVPEPGEGAAQAALSE